MRFDRAGYAALRLHVSQVLIGRLFGTSRPVRYLACEDPASGNFEVLSTFDQSRAELPKPGPPFFASKLVPKSAIYRLPEALIDGATSYIYDQDNRLIGDAISYAVSTALIDRPAKPLRPKRLVDEGDFLYLGVQGYYHWLLEDFPAYLQARLVAPNATTLIRQRSPRFVTDALELLDQPFVYMPISARVSSLVFASKGILALPNSVDVETLRAFCDDLNLSPIGARKVYISRRDSGRMPINEDDVEALMSARGYRVVQLTGLPLGEQMTIFRNAHRIVGTHGAGLANLAWSLPELTKFLEIRREGQLLCFEWLARTAGIEYAALTSPEHGPWNVNLDDLAAALDAME